MCMPCPPSCRQRDEAKARRKDAGLDHVVISERWDKKAAKYMTQELPFPFKDKVAYERSMRQPLGKDFNTDESFRYVCDPDEGMCVCIHKRLCPTTTAT